MMAGGQSSPSRSHLPTSMKTRDAKNKIKILLLKAVVVIAIVLVQLDNRASSSSSLMKLKLRDYQIIGSNWISSMYLHRIGCILSDEKGLGRKVQAIHFLSNLASERGNWGPHLIVSPSGSLFIWQMIFTRWCPALRMLVYCGDAQERIVQRLVRTSFVLCFIGSFQNQNDLTYMPLLWAVTCGPPGGLRISNTSRLPVT